MHAEHTLQQPAPAPANDKDSQGRFTKGNAGGPGNPFARQVAALRRTLLASVTPEDLAAITHALVAEAKKGNVQAAKLLLGYLIGKPAPAPNPDRLDIDEWDQFKEEGKMMQDLPHLTVSPEPDLPLDMVRNIRPAATRDLTRGMRDVLRQPEQFKNMPTLEALQQAMSPSANGKSKAKPATPAQAATGAAPSTNGHAAGLRPQVADLLQELVCQLGPLANGKSRLP